MSPRPRKNEDKAKGKAKAKTKSKAVKSAPAKRPKAAKTGAEGKTAKASGTAKTGAASKAAKTAKTAKASGTAKTGAASKAPGALKTAKAPKPAPAPGAAAAVAAGKSLRERLNAYQHSSFASPCAYSKNEQFINRELSWLQFDLRVLQEARDRGNPLMERLSFLSITANNLDEFVMVRVASLKDMAEASYSGCDLAGLTTAEQLSAISEQMHALVNLMYSTYSRSIVPALRGAGIAILGPEELDGEQLAEVKAYFDEIIYPILTPMAVDSARPFPLINNKSLNICALLEKPDEESKFVTIQVPGLIPRLYRLKSAPSQTADEEGRPLRHTFILLEDIIRLFLPDLFPGMEILAHSVYRIMRNADLDFDEEEAADLLLEIEKQVRMRLWGQVIRLEVEEKTDRRLIAILLPNLKVEERDVYLIDGPLDLTLLGKMRADEHIRQNASWYYPPYQPQVPYLVTRRREALLAKGADEPDLFRLIREGGILMHHPYESFDTVLAFIRAASADPQVLAIKLTLYRISGDSPLIGYLEEAAKNGKQVMVLVELKARFDEERNIHWARRLEKAGCHVIYGLVGLKTHSKITLVVRREEEGIRRYLHLGTGNYNDQTAKLYTDMGYLVSNVELGEDGTEFFNMLSGFAEPDYWNALVAAPLWLRGTFEKLIEREAAEVAAGRRGRIRCKMNSLVDEDIIKKLYAASQAGVEIDLIVRGICCLRPGVPGLSDNIRVRSLIGRYLEHARIFEFHNAGKTELYLASADWMTRNLDRRVELLFPIYEEDCRALVREVLDLQFEDNIRAHLMQPDGTYKKPDRRGKTALDSQKHCARLALERAPKAPNVLETRAFQPAVAPED